jgi:hypothetical protein
VPQTQPVSSTLILSPNILLPNTNCEKFRDIEYTVSQRQGLLTDTNTIACRETETKNQSSQIGFVCETEMAAAS